MGKVVLYMLLASTGAVAVFRPWVGVVASYFIIILGPQYIWWWHFGGVRPIYWVMLPTIAGFVIMLFAGKNDLKHIYNKRILFQFVLFGAFVISYYLGPYVHVFNQFRFSDPTVVFDLVLKIFVLFFIGSACIDTEKKFQYMILIFIVSIVYLTYWINDMYLFQGRYGRIAGPVGIYGNGTYSDENTFAMFFVVGGPFLYYAGLYCRKNIYRCSLWLIIPFAWHGIFLTGSRGGLVGLIVTVLVVILRSKKRLLATMIILPLFATAYVWQAGDVMKGRADTITEFDQERSASTRIEAWSAAISMIKAHPLTGVGLASFGQAFPTFSEYEPREAHNTLFQITAESGVIAGAMYILIILNSLKNLTRKFNPQGTSELLLMAREAILASFCGLVVCSMFLSLQVFEIFFFLCILANSSIHLTKTSGNYSNA